jgi:hypothetical protein
MFLPRFGAGKTNYAVSPPQWVNNRYGSFGSNPNIAVDFVNNAAWVKGVGQGTPSQFLTCVSNSTRWRDDTSGNWTSFAPATLAYSNKGLRVWENRTNAIRNNSMQGAVVGTPGTLPTNWTSGGGSGIVPQVAAIGTENGMDYIDLRFAGGSGNTNLFLDVNNVIAAANGQIWSNSLYYRISAGSLTNVTSVQIAENEYNAALAGVGTHQVAVTTATASWQRFTYNNVTLTGTATAWLQPFIQVQSSGAIDLTLRLAWPQLEQAAFAGMPIRTSNTIRNSSIAGAVVGTPGTLPTYWSQTQNIGIVPAVAAVGTDNGIDYVDIKVTGTTATGHQVNIYIETGNGISAASGQTWTSSIFLRLVGGSTANLNQIDHLIQPLNAAQVVLAGIDVVYSAATINTWTSMTRVTSTGTLGDATTTYVRSVLTFNFATAPVAVDITLRIGWPQLEQSAAASPPQRTVAGTVGVNTPAEVVTMSGLSITSALTQYAAYVSYGIVSGGTETIIQIDDGTNSNRQILSITQSTGRAASMNSVVAGTIQGIQNANPLYAANTPFRAAEAGAAGDRAICANGLPVTAVGGNFPSGMVNASFGSQLGSFFLNGDMTEFGIWLNTRVPNSSMAAGTT